MKWKIIIGGAVVLTLAGCGTAATSSTSTSSTPGSSAPAASASSAPTSTPAAATNGGLPCNPASKNCWVPDVGEKIMAYKPAQHYSDARVLAAAAGCTVLSGGSYSPATPTARSAACGFGGAVEGDGLSEATIFSSSADEASLAGQAEQNAAGDATSDYAVFGPGWAISTITTVTDAQALQIQDVTGGAVVCFYPQSEDC
jgi:hypothetical protein